MQGNTEYFPGRVCSVLAHVHLDLAFIRHVSFPRLDRRGSPPEEPASSGATAWERGFAGDLGAVGPEGEPHLMFGDSHSCQRLSVYQGWAGVAGTVSSSERGTCLPR